MFLELMQFVTASGACTAPTVGIEGLWHHAQVAGCAKYIEWANSHSLCKESVAECAGIRTVTISITRNDTHFYICPRGGCNHSLTTDCHTVNYNTGGGITTNSTELACIDGSDTYSACSLVLRPLSCNGHAIPANMSADVIYSMTADGRMNMTRAVGGISWQNLFERKAAEPRASSGDAWEHLGPRNIFDDDSGRGEAGTVADAASPVSNPSIIYTGGKNNGASSGVLKSVDMGRTWARASGGLFDSRVRGLFVHPDSVDGVHVYCEPLHRGGIAYVVAMHR